MFKQKLITELKRHPDLYNEIRAELSTPRLLRGNQLPDNNYTSDPNEDKFLEKADEDALIDAIIINFNYFIEYEREMREGDL
ncbi:hypothetical protein [Halanaerobacter jeridensis]|uniref:Uncharacterized protein n=1 Tax=Halanaerobacter jeridensis TaxID=706427 RepID=A0A939BNL4_9FIRM|nr:hypothetical protein [Halanaerobacter jeridensis]MBM7555443.1 hypothetical protein [Halanaerobacter jeridensis]